MTRRIRIDDEALDELVGAARWYEERERGRGALFSNAAFARVEALNSLPDAGVPVQGVSGTRLPARFGCCAIPIWSCTRSQTTRSESLRSPKNDNSPATGPTNSSRSPCRSRNDMGRRRRIRCSRELVRG